MRYCCRLRRLAELRSSPSPPTTLFWSLHGVFSAARELAAAAAAACGRPRASLLVFPRFRSAFRPRLRGRTRRRRGEAGILGVIALCPALRAGVFGLLWAAGAPLLPAALISKVVFLAAFVSGALAPSLPHCATLHAVTRYAAGRPHSLTASAVAARLRRSRRFGIFRGLRPSSARPLGGSSPLPPWGCRASLRPSLASPSALLSVVSPPFLFGDTTSSVADDDAAMGSRRVRPFASLRDAPDGRLRPRPTCGGVRSAALRPPLCRPQGSLAAAEGCAWTTTKAQ